MPSVVIKALTPTTVTRKPLTAPARAPTAKATTMAIGIGWPSAAVAMATPDRAMMDATERSNCPAMISNVPGIATIPVTAMAVRTFKKLARVRNAGARIENVTISTIRTTTRAVILGAERRRRGAPSSGGARRRFCDRGQSDGLVQDRPPAAATMSPAVIWSPLQLRGRSGLEPSPAPGRPTAQPPRGHSSPPARRARPR